MTSAPRRVPRAVYRLQLHGGVGLDDAAALVDYLDLLGVEDLYLSPLFAAPPDAAHGYHIVDPTQVDPQIGGPDALGRLRAALDRNRMGILLDIVPNHLAAHPHNPWWRDVLARGRSSRYARHFDIDWEAGGGKVVLPVLGRPLDEAIAAGEITVEGDEVVYLDMRLPVAPDRPADGRRLREVLEAQHYRLTFWRTGLDELNYRRFFDITDLVAVRVEDTDVFPDVHSLIAQLIGDGIVDGLRVDHIDGLRDPSGYLERLQEATTHEPGGPTYVVVEKILEGDEPLPPEWPVAGTTGYEFLNAANAVQVDPAGLGVLDDAYTRFVGAVTPVDDLLHDSKRRALEILFAREVDRLADHLADLRARVLDAPDASRSALRDRLVAASACFPAYRTYIRDAAIGPDDRERLDTMFAETRHRYPEADDAALGFLERVLRMDLPDSLDDGVRDDWLDVVMRWQQLTGPAMAKGFEDRTLYVYNRLVSLNEVGADADGIARPHGVDGFHERVAARARVWPQAIATTSTHDTKRSEDVRARLNVLSEIAGHWSETVERWSAHLAETRTEVGGGAVPRPNEEWLIYQSLVGMWPLDEADEPAVRSRLKEYVVKAAREGKQHTSWLDPNEDHERALVRFVDAALDDRAFVDDVRAFVGSVARRGAVNALAQLTLKLVAPGVPDIYQGCELWDWSLVDPDNRRPVDYRRRIDALVDITRRADTGRLGLAHGLREQWADGRLKMFVTWTLLELRRSHPALFRDGAYEALRAEARHADRVVAFARVTDEGWVAAIVPRLTAAVCDEETWPIGAVWEDTAVVLPQAGPVHEVISGVDREAGEEGLRLADALAELPVAVVVPATRARRRDGAGLGRGRARRGR